MRLQARRVAVLGVALTLTLGALFGMQHWLFLTQTKLPLQTQLERLPEVSHVSLNLSSASPSVSVTLRSVPNLEETYASISKTVQHLAPGAALHISGTSDKALANAAQILSFPVEQGIATGQFVEMRKDVLQEASNLHVKARIYVDSQNVYLALYDQDKSAYFIYSRGAK